MAKLEDMKQYQDKYDALKYGLAELIREAHKEGIPDEVIGFIIQETINSFNLMKYCQKWLEEITD